MFRVFALPMTTAYQSIWDLLVTAGLCDSLGNELVSSVKNGAIIPDRVCQLDIRGGDGNTGNVLYRDQQAALSTAQIVSNMSKRSNRNSICLRDYQFKSATDGDKIVVEIESV